jgi:hypothetical protein
VLDNDPFLDKLRGDPEFHGFLARQRAQWARCDRVL